MNTQQNRDIHNPRQKALIGVEGQVTELNYFQCCIYKLITNSSYDKINFEHHNRDKVLKQIQKITLEEALTKSQNDNAEQNQDNTEQKKFEPNYDKLNEILENSNHSSTNDTIKDYVCYVLDTEQKSKPNSISKMLENENSNGISTLYDTLKSYRNNNNQQIFFTDTQFEFWLALHFDEDNNNTINIDNIIDNNQHNINQIINYWLVLAGNDTGFKASKKNISKKNPNVNLYHKGVKKACQRSEKIYKNLLAKHHQDNMSILNDNHLFSEIHLLLERLLK